MNNSRPIQTQMIRDYKRTTAKNHFTSQVILGDNERQSAWHDLAMQENIVAIQLKAIESYLEAYKQQVWL